jgi:hypothetical protein
MSSWLINKIVNIDGDRPNHHFATLGTINWIKALRIYCENERFNYINIKKFYDNLRPNSGIGIEQEIASFEHLVFGIHYLSSLKELSKVDCKTAIIRSAIITWYYNIYYCTKAMLVASTGNDAETHSKIAKMYHTDLVNKGKIIEPFHWTVESLVPNDYKDEIDALKNGNPYDTNNTPRNEYEAQGVLLSYLKGTAKRESEISQENIKGSQEFKNLNVKDFRKKVARELRDRQLKKKKVNFLNQSFRFRGKANYRDGIYLSYDNNYISDAVMSTFLDDLTRVTEAFTLMSYEFVRKSVRRNSWENFREDYDKNNRIKFDIDELINN